jgi:hypothetical protein
VFSHRFQAVHRHETAPVNHVRQRAYVAKNCPMPASSPLIDRVLFVTRRLNVGRVSKLRGATMTPANTPVSGP